MSASTASAWWVAQDGRPGGPFSTVAVLELVRDRKIAAETAACPVGGTQWQPLLSFPELAEGLRGTIPPPPPLLLGTSPPAFFVLPVWQTLFALAGWYHFAFVPAFVASGLFLSWLCPSNFLDDSPTRGNECIASAAEGIVGLILVMVGCIAGYGLLERRRDAVVLATIVTALGWVVGFCGFAVQLIIEMLAPPEARRPELEVEYGPILATLCVIYFVVKLCSMVFDALSLVALWKVRPTLSEGAAPQERSDYGVGEASPANMGRN